ncbi:DUF1206 domain-containing protein [Pontibacter liquoris]|uniref:DUF1206 domain-containing protein n=1 Tax=Pontibacter liquoris TaxID=2905677 RepID=UPI001FA6B3E4|nr:DUF1206 domain-containing protein [Pontibacter liquoris]
MHATKQIKRWICLLPVYGCFSTGLIYVAIGVIAILSFLRLKQGGADESSLLAYLSDYTIGRVFVWIILLGSVSYIIWRIYESLKDPYGYGRQLKGIALRVGIALSSVADAFIAYAAIAVLLGISNIPENGQPQEQRQLVSQLLQHNMGNWAIIGAGLIILITAIVQLLYGITKGYKERLDIDRLYAILKPLVHPLAWAGYVARGIILGIIGFFFLKAGVLENARYVVNTDKAFDFIGDRVGHFYFIAVAVGTICYGLFMFALGAADNPDKE